MKQEILKALKNKTKRMEDINIVKPVEEFKKGLKIETKEHSDIDDSKHDIAKKIVKAHLKEDPKYYSKEENEDNDNEDDEEKPIKKVLKNYKK